jgi:Polyketide cyclase / dehydrase and lipid transport
MEKLHFEISINAEPEKIWHAVVDPNSYREWTTEFNPTSRFEGGWDKGDAIRFLGTNDKGEVEGMVSEIAESRKHSFISIRHKGYIHGDKEDTTSEAIRKWAPAYENYTLIKMNDCTRFEVDMDAENAFVAMFSEMWPKALKRLKEIAER